MLAFFLGLFGPTQREIIAAYRATRVSPSNARSEEGK